MADRTKRTEIEIYRMKWNTFSLSTIVNIDIFIQTISQKIKLSCTSHNPTFSDDIVTRRICFRQENRSIRASK